VESNFISVHTHLMECAFVPKEVAEELAELKAMRREQTSTLKSGSQKAFFARVWKRLHEDLEDDDDTSQEDSIEEGGDATTTSNCTASSQPTQEHVSLDVLMNAAKTPAAKEIVSTVASPVSPEQQEQNMFDVKTSTPHDVRMEEDSSAKLSVLTASETTSKEVAPQEADETPLMEEDEREKQTKEKKNDGSQIGMRSTSPIKIEMKDEETTEVGMQPAPEPRDVKVVAAPSTKVEETKQTDEQLVREEVSCEDSAAEVATPSASQHEVTESSTNITKDADETLATPLSNNDEVATPLSPKVSDAPIAPVEGRPQVVNEDAMDTTVDDKKSQDEQPNMVGV
jgi:hypothetical protein